MADPWALQKLIDQNDKVLKGNENAQIKLIESAILAALADLEDELKRLNAKAQADVDAAPTLELKRARATLLLAKMKAQANIFKYGTTKSGVSSKMAYWTKKTFNDSIANAHQLIAQYQGELNFSAHVLPYEIDEAVKRSLALMDKHGEDFATKARETIVSGLVRGKPLRETSRRLHELTGTLLWKCERVVRTESINAADVARRRAYFENNIDYVQRIATQDSRVCGYCAARHGMVYPINEAPAVIHPHDRCANLPFKFEWFEEGEVDIDWWQNSKDAVVRASKEAPNYGIAPFEKGKKAPLYLWRPEWQRDSAAFRARLAYVGIDPTKFFVPPNIEKLPPQPAPKPQRALPPGLDHDKILELDLHEEVPSWALVGADAHAKHSYGMVLFDEQGRVLLREPTGHFDGYHWTFPKGGARPGEHPLKVALRETTEETGHSAQVLGLVPGTFKSGSSTTNHLFIGKSVAHNPALMDAETQSTRWVTFAEAIDLINQSTNVQGRQRDLAVLDAAFKTFKGLQTGQPNELQKAIETHSLIVAKKKAEQEAQAKRAAAKLARERADAKAAKLAAFQAALEKRKSEIIQFYAAKINNPSTPAAKIAEYKQKAKEAVELIKQGIMVPKPKARGRPPGSKNKPPSKGPIPTTLTETLQDRILARWNAQTPAPRSITPKAEFPADFGDLEDIKRLGGTTGARLMRDRNTGKQYVVKYGLSEAHIEEEMYADSTYHALGVDVPAFKRYVVNGRPVKVAEFLEGEVLSEVWARANDTERTRIRRKLQEGFVADALMGNWDVIGTGKDNILVTKDGRYVRIDNGGSFRWRAQGDYKKPDEWNAYPVELWSMRGLWPGIRFSPDAKDIFHDMKLSDIGTAASAYSRPEVIARLKAILPQELSSVVAQRLAQFDHIAGVERTLREDRYRSAYIEDFARAILEIRREGFVDKMPTQLKTKAARFPRMGADAKRWGEFQTSDVVDENGKLWDSLREKGSLWDNFLTYLDTNGGSNNALFTYMDQQGISSWSGFSGAMKYHLARVMRDVPDDDLFWHYGGIAGAEREYQNATRHIGTDVFNRTFTLYHAWTYEMLNKTNFAHNDKTRRSVLLMRTEDYTNVVVRYGFQRGMTKIYKRGALESTSIFAPITVQGHELMFSEVPYHRVFGAYFTDRRAPGGYREHAFLGDSENEFVAHLDGLEAYYWGSV